MDLLDLLLAVLDKSGGWLNRRVSHVSAGPRPADYSGMGRAQRLAIIGIIAAVLAGGVLLIKG